MLQLHAPLFAALTCATRYPLTVQLTIEKLVYGGDGLARVPAAGDERRGKTIFTPFVLPGEVVEASVIEERKGFARAELVQVLEPSAARIAPPCPHFGVCGGCQYQHADYAAQLQCKRQILEETILRGAGTALRAAGLSVPEIQVHSGPEYGFRNRTRMKFSFDPEFAVGYYRHGSHALEPVRHCPISSPLINQALAALWELAAEAREYTALREVQFFANHDDTQLRLELFIDHNADPAQLQGYARALRERLPQIAGVAVFRAAGGRRAETEWDESDLESAPLNRAGAPFNEGAPSLDYEVNGYRYRVSAGSFFQTNRFLAGRLVELVSANRSGRAALDLYAGVGLFTLPLAQQFEKVTAVEIAPSSYADLTANAAATKAALRIRTVHSTTEDYLNSARGRWEYAVVDPPRAGLGERAARALARLSIPRITYVSCDPATLARDLVPLLGAGYRIEQAHLVDLFPQSYHMESVLYLAR